MNAKLVRETNGAQYSVKDEVRKLRRAARTVCATKESALRFLASTKMYTAKGRLKPQFS